VDPVDRYEAEAQGLKPDTWDGSTPDRGFDGNPGTAMDVREDLDRIQREVERQGLLTYEDGFVGEQASRQAKWNAFVGHEVATSVDRLVQAVDAINVTQPGVYPESVPEGEIWVDVPFYSQKWHAAEHLLVKARESGIATDAMEVVGRATAIKPGKEYWPEYEMVGDLSGSTETILRWKLTDQGSAEHVARLFWQETKKRRAGEVSLRWDAPDIRIWGAAPVSGFRQTACYRKTTGDGMDVVTLRKSPGGKCEQVGLRLGRLAPQVNPELFGFLNG
jgi:hypothetical protein